MVCLSRPYHFKFFKGSLLQILLGPFLNTVSSLVILNLQKRIQNPIKHLRWNFWQKIVSNLQLLITFAKSSMLDVWLTSAYDVFKFSSNSAVPEILKFKRPNLRLVVFMFDKNLYLFIGFYIKNRTSWRSCASMLVMSIGAKM